MLPIPIVSSNYFFTCSTVTTKWSTSVHHYFYHRQGFNLSPAADEETANGNVDG